MRYDPSTLPNDTYVVKFDQFQTEAFQITDFFLPCLWSLCCRSNVFTSSQTSLHGGGPSHSFICKSQGFLTQVRMMPSLVCGTCLIKDVAPVVITLKSGFRPYLRQYPLKLDAVAGIRLMIEAFLKSGVITECPDSPVNTPVFPVPKAPPSVGWRLVQDLQAVISNVISRAPLVPDPHTLLNDLQPQHQFFTVVDLANAFFSIPGRRLTFVPLPQGFTDSPCIFSMAMSASLSKFQPPNGSQILLYIDNILVASPDKKTCPFGSVALLNFLHSQGHFLHSQGQKCSKSKILLAQKQVKFLGHLVSASAEAILASAKIVLYHPLTLHVPHDVSALLNQTFLSPARHLHFMTLLLSQPHLTVRRNNFKTSYSFAYF
uniref:ribonuclease H n=1 Tax=Oryzias sinensis TaxID=183150 RepID=A0A8C7WQI3_9TELE